MEERRISIPTTGSKYGVITAIIFIVYFLVMRSLHLAGQTELRFANYIFLATNIFLALNEVRHKLHKHRLNYLPGMGLGIWITAVTGLIFAIFMVVYVQIDPPFLTALSSYVPYPNGISPSTIGFAAFAETLVFGVVQSLILMQYFKRNQEKQSEAEEEASEGHIFHRHAGHS